MKCAWLVTLVLFLSLAAAAQNIKAAEDWPYPVGVTTADCSLSLAPSVLLYGECHLRDGLYLTTDGGVTWTKFQGAKGLDGLPGTAASITVNNVISLPPGSSPTVTNVGNSSSALLNFGIPQGLPGAMGPGWTSCDISITNFKITSTSTRTGTVSFSNCH
jgi:hypothetical protein